MMAGETEDGFSFQADHLPTGSISFGRFELESLSWERRSSFSHNRYLEEVERYSTPGSVTQKRAILEAHFKKKPILPQASFENQNECQTTENHLGHQASCPDECQDHDDGRRPEFSWHDETCGSNGDLECEDQETWPSEIPMESMLCSDDRVVDTACERTDHDEMLQDQTECDSMTLNKDDLCLVIDQEPDNKDVIVEELLEKKETVTREEVLQNKDAIVVDQLKSDVSSKSPVVQKKRASTLKKKPQKSPLKVKETIDQKSAKIKRMDPVRIEQNLGKSSLERSFVSSGKMISSSVKKMERESSLETKPLKQLSLRTPMHKTTVSENLKVEASIHMKTKGSQGSNRRNEGNSEKDVRTKKGGVAPRSVSGRSELDVHRPVSRSKLVAESAKQETKQSVAIFSFKSDERAEKRKEYFLKLEEKLHAKEAEMNEIQARTQEETEAAIKQLRKSLNFKATPMPSFYHEAVPRGEEGKKNIATTSKHQKVRSKCSSPRSRTCGEKSPSLPNASSHESPSADESSQSSRSAKPTEKGRTMKKQSLKERVSMERKEGLLVG